MSDRCPKCRRPWLPEVIDLCDMPKYCRTTDDAECFEARAELYWRALLDIWYASARYDLDSGDLARVNRLAAEALAVNDPAVVAAVLQ